MSDEEVKFETEQPPVEPIASDPVADLAPELPADEPVSVVVEPISHGEAAQRAANKMPHSERTVNGGKR